MTSFVPAESATTVLPREDWDPMERVREFALRLVGWPSETGSDGEAAFADHLECLLREIPYFQDHPEDLAVIDSHGSPARRNVVALVRGQGRKTLALAGHFDTASIANYRDLAPLACRPEELRSALVADLSARPRTEQEERVLGDLRSGDFLPGRAMLDMKSGIAAGIALLERHAAAPERIGNLLLLATPDEERNSRGMRSLRDALPGLAARWDLDLAAAINLDATSDQGEGEEGRAIYQGTIGKLMPFAFVIGEPSHAAYPFDGISTHLIAASVMQAIEVNTALCDRGAGEVSPPPICLEGRDLRGDYEVTTPERAFLAFNWLSHSWTADDLFARFKTQVEEALKDAMTRFEGEASAYAEIAGRRRQGAARNPTVLTYAELRTQVSDSGGDAALARVDALTAALARDDDPLVKTRMIVEAAVAEARLGGPAVVVGFASLHYPHTHLDHNRPEDRAFASAVEEARAESERRLGQSVVYRQTFLGISDMSFLGHAPAAAETAFVAVNTPAADLVDRPPETLLRFPVVNIGPWGRDYHQRLERVHSRYAFQDLPLLLAGIADRFLGAGKRSEN